LYDKYNSNWDCYMYKKYNSNWDCL
jgi:hypothetical protein